MAVPYTFGTATASIPLSQLDSNFATVITLGNTAIQLGNTVTTLNNMTLANVTISSGNITLTNVSATTANVTTANVVTLIVTGNETVQGNTTVTGTATAAKFIPTGTSVTGNGMYLPATNSVGISTAGTNAVYIDASQNVGIGITSPTHKLHIVDTTYASLYIKSSSTNFAGMEIENTNSATKWTVGVEGGAYNTAGLFSIGIDGVGVKTAIDSSGNLLVGGTTAYGKITSNSSTNDLYAGYNGASQKFAVTNGGTIFAVNTTISAISDIRYKENVRDLDVGLDKIMALKPRLYDWKEGKGSDIKNARGFIAQEFEQVFPDLIDIWKETPPEGEEPYKSIRQDLIPVLVKAIQEQQALITTLTARISALER
jgi:hypothetical protein